MVFVLSVGGRAFLDRMLGTGTTCFSVSVAISTFDAEGTAIFNSITDQGRHIKASMEWSCTTALGGGNVKLLCVTTKVQPQMKWMAYTQPEAARLPAIKTEENPDAIHFHFSQFTQQASTCMLT